MKDLVLYCKSYRRDFLRLKRLYESIQRFNRDSITFYVSTPECDKKELYQLMPDDSFKWIADEDIILANPKLTIDEVNKLPGNVSQAIIKSEFWRLEISKNYVCLDSDCIFIKDFYVSNFLVRDDNPYTIIFENKDYFQLAINRNEKKSYFNLKRESDQVMKIFGRHGPNYYCPCPPFIWSSKVWNSLNENYLKPNNISFLELATNMGEKSLVHPETQIYIEALLKFRAIDLYPKEPLFRVYYNLWHYYLFKRLGERESRLKENFMGVVYQSNWQLELDYKYSGKSFFSMILKKTKRLLRYLQSYI